MFPMVEMSGPEHFHEINDILLTYNRRNPLSVDKVSREEIQNGMVEKYMNELMDEIRAGDTRYIEFSNQEEQSSHDKKAVSDIF